MDITGIKDFLDKIIESYIEQSVDPDQIDNILEELNIGNLSKEIASKLSERILTYQIHNVKGQIYCQECFRPHGVWNGPSHGGFEDSSLLKHGTTIILADDF